MKLDIIVDSDDIEKIFTDIIEAKFKTKVIHCSGTGNARNSEDYRRYGPVHCTFQIEIPDDTKPSPESIVEFDRKLDPLL